MEHKPSKGLKNRTRTSITIEPEIIGVIRDQNQNISKLVSKLLKEYAIKQGWINEDES